MYIESDSGKNLIMVLVQSHASIVYYIQFKETMSFHEDIEGRLRGDEKETWFTSWPLMTVKKK